MKVWKGSRGTALLFLTSALEGGGGGVVNAKPELLYPKEKPGICSIGGWPWGWSGWVQNISLPPGIDPQTVLSRYTDYAMLAHKIHHHEHPEFHIYNFFTYTQFAL